MTAENAVRPRQVISSPYHVAVDSQKNVYVADTYNQRIQKFTMAGAYLGSIRGLAAPRGLCVDSDDLLYIANRYNDRILIYDWTTTSPVPVWDSSLVDPPFTFVEPIDVASDGENMYITLSTQASGLRAWARVGATMTLPSAQPDPFCSGIVRRTLSCERSVKTSSSTAVTSSDVQ